MNAHFTCFHAEELADTPEPKRWIWDGYLHPGQLTLFTSLWKSGKTTLLSHLLTQRKPGGLLAGRTLAPGNTLVVSEETRLLWHERHARLRFAAGASFICQPFVGLPSALQWLEFVEYVQELHAERRFDLMILDPVSRFVPGCEDSAQGRFSDALRSLQTLTRLGLALLIVHHPSKTAAPQGMLSRGSGMLPQSVDIVMEMYRVAPNDSADRRRRLIAQSRDPATPASVLLELNAEGSAYRVIEDRPPDDFDEAWLPLRRLFESADKELTRQQVRAAWPNSFPPPSRNTLWRLLHRAVERGLLRRTGDGTKRSPFLYSLPGSAKVWQPTPSATPNADAWLDRWQEQYPTPPEWAEEGLSRDMEAES